MEEEASRKERACLQRQPSYGTNDQRGRAPLHPREEAYVLQGLCREFPVCIFVIETKRGIQRCHFSYIYFGFPTFFLVISI